MGESKIDRIKQVLRRQAIAIISLILSIFAIGISFQANLEMKKQTQIMDEQTKIAKEAYMVAKKQADTAIAAAKANLLENSAGVEMLRQKYPGRYGWPKK